MAHELDFKANGVAAMFSVRETPWHKEGTLLTKAPSFEEALVVAGLDYEVALRPLAFAPCVPKLPEDLSGYGFTATGRGFAVVRTDREDTKEGVLSIVGDAYSLLQNREAFEVLKPLIDAGVAFLETGGVLRGGRDAWLLVRFNVDDPVVREVFADEVMPFGVIHTSHGVRRAVIMETPVRIVCANTLAQAYGSKRARETAIGIIHRGQARVRLVEAAQKMFGGLTERYRGIAENYELMKRTILTVEEFMDSVLEMAAPNPKYDADERTTAGFEAALTRARKKREALTEAWMSGIGHSGSHTAWDAFNGAMQVLDHDNDLYPVKGSRVESMMSGPLAHRKEKVGAAILAVCRKKA